MFTEAELRTLSRALEDRIFYLRETMNSYGLQNLAEARRLQAKVKDQLANGSWRVEE